MEEKQEEGVVRLAMLGMLGKGIRVQKSKRDSPWCKREYKGPRHGWMLVSAAGCGKAVKGGDLSSPTLGSLPTELCISLES